MLALYLYARAGSREPHEIRAEIGTRLGEDVTSLVASDHAGDPFTAIKTNEPPSLSIEKPSPETVAINLPAIPSLARFGPELAGPEMLEGPDLGLATDAAAGRGAGAGPPSAKGKGPKFRVHAEDITAPFSGRSGLTRAQLVRREGGTVRSEKAVEDGLDWLARHQRDDGGWSLNFQGQCRGEGCPSHPCIDSDSAATGLALLPMLGAGHIHTAKSRYQGHVRRGLDWIVSHQDADGGLFVGGDHLSPLYSHAIATMALCESYGLSKDPLLREPAQRAINFIVKAQNAADGGWRYFPGQAGDTSVFGWQMFALRSARLAGLKLPKNVIAGCKAYLDAAAVDRKITYAYQPGRPATPVMTAEALLSRQYLGWPRDFPPLVKGAAHVAADLEESGVRNIYYWYYATQLLHNMQNKDWRRWNAHVREGLIAMQVTGPSCDGGAGTRSSRSPTSGRRRRAGCS